MRTLFQTIKQQFLEGNDLVLVSVTASSGLRQEVPVPACWSEKTAEFPEPSEVEL